MVRWIVESSLKLRFVVVTLAAAVVFFGAGQLREMPVDILPEFAPPLVEIQTEALGLSTAEVEALITNPMEEFLAGIPWLETMRSKSVTGLSSIVLVFQPGTDFKRARQFVQERLNNAGVLPNVVETADDAAAAVVDQPDCEYRPVIGRAVRNRDVGSGAMEDPAASDGSARRCQRRDLGPAQAPAPGAGRPGAAARLRACRLNRSSRPPATRCGGLH